MVLGNVTVVGGLEVVVVKMGSTGHTVDSAGALETSCMKQNQNIYKYKTCI